jgi:hypothetical protein
MSGDPIWAGLVGPPGCGETEVVQSVGGLAEVTRPGHRRQDAWQVFHVFHVGDCCIFGRHALENCRWSRFQPLSRLAPITAWRWRVFARRCSFEA